MSVGVAEDRAAPDLLPRHIAKTEEPFCGGHERLR